MGGKERRKSVRHLLGATAEVHLGPRTVEGKVRDVSQHGMGLQLPIEPGELLLGSLIWIVSRHIAPSAITATVRRIGADGEIGVEFEEVLTGEMLDLVESLPLPLDLD